MCLYDRNKPRPGRSVNQGPVIWYGNAIINVVSRNPDPSLPRAQNS